MIKLLFEYACELKTGHCDIWYENDESVLSYQVENGLELLGYLDSRISILSCTNQAIRWDISKIHSLKWIFS